MKLKGFGGKQSWPNRFTIWQCLECLSKTTENLSQVRKDLVEVVTRECALV